MTRIERDTVMAHLRMEDVLSHLGIKGQWRGRWMHTARCAETDHGSQCFAASRDGKWHCHSCDKGGGMLDLLGLGERLDLKDKANFPAVLAIAARIAGVEDDDSFGPQTKPAPIARPAEPPLKPFAERLEIARRRATWVWAHLSEPSRPIYAYLKHRQIDPDVALCRETVMSTPLRIPKPGSDASPDLVRLWQTMWNFSMVIPVRSCKDGALVDLRMRRLDPKDGQPKIIGMLGGLTAEPESPGRPRQLVGCYGNPHNIDADLVVLCEGWGDYFTALVEFPNAQVVASVEAGSLPLVAAHVAREMAARDDSCRLIIVEQRDPPRVNKAKNDGTMIAGAADVSINESPNAATKVACSHLGPRRLGWLYCEDDRLTPEGEPVKDLNDLVRVGADVRGMVRMWSDVGTGGPAGD
jgi:hypothetical protein